jgi:hypothetical protein
MPDEPSGANQPDNSDRNPNAQGPVSPILPISPQSGGPGAPRTKNSANNIAETATAKELHWLEKLNFAGQFCLVIVGIIAASIYGCQLSVMKGQLGQMEGSSGQADKLLRLYQRNSRNRPEIPAIWP